MKIKIVKRRNYPALNKFYDAFEVGNTGKLCVAIGGDGTFIRAAKEFDGPILPIRSKENGSIGYYADISTDDIDYAIKKLKSGSYTVERLGNKIMVDYNGRHYYAVNEVVLNNLLEEVSFKVYEVVNGRRHALYPYTMSGDGVLVTSEVGSTAYNKSAGGPVILNPDAFCITFINVDGPYRNPIVVDVKREIEIEIVKYKGRLRYDGINIGLLKPGSRFRVRLSDKELRVVRFKERRESFGEKLERVIRSRMEK